MRMKEFSFSRFGIEAISIAIQQRAGGGDGGRIALRRHLAKSRWQEPVPSMDASKAATAPGREKCQ